MKKTLRLTLSALCLALAYVLPFLTGQIPEIGSMLCPMHIPVLLCGFLCGWPYGLAVGCIAPIFRSLTLGMPPLFPQAFCMAFELAVYGAMSGLLHRILPRRRIFTYVSLLIAMLLGRIVWGMMMLLCIGWKGGQFTFSAFLSGALLQAIPGILLQLILVPLVVMLIERSKLLSAEK